MMKSFKVIAYHLGNRIDLKAFRLSSKHHLLKREHSFSIIQILLKPGLDAKWLAIAHP